MWDLTLPAKRTEMLTSKSNNDFITHESSITVARDLVHVTKPTLAPSLSFSVLGVFIAALPPFQAPIGKRNGPYFNLNERQLI